MNLSSNIRRFPPPPLRRRQVVGSIGLICVLLLKSSLCCGENVVFLWGRGDGGETKNATEKLAEPLVTDRPDFTNSAATVGLGLVQIEEGYTYAYDANSIGSTVSHSYPETLLRVGLLAEWLEARVGWNYAAVGNTEFGAGKTDGSGSDPLYLGVKLALTGQEDFLPAMGMLVQMSVPTGPADVGGDETLPGLAWLYGWDLNDWISLGGMTQGNRALDSITGRPYLEFSQSWSFGYDLSEHFGAYTEWYVISPDGADFDHCQNYVDAGVTYLLSDNLQLDIRYGVGLNEAADNYFAGAGVTWRPLLLYRALSQR